MKEKIPVPAPKIEKNKESATIIALQRAKEGLARILDAVEKGKPISNLSIELIQAELMYAEEQHKEHYRAAFKDSLTGLLNRRAFEEALDAKMARAKEFPSDRLYAFYIDLDKFKLVNDTYGHDVGDRYLKSIGNNVRAALRPDDTFARIGGDEFAALCFVRHKLMEGEDKKQVSAAEADQILLRINYALDAARQELNEKIKEIFPDKSLSYETGSVGYSFYNPTDQTQDPKDFIKEADRKMYQMKKDDGVSD